MKDSCKGILTLWCITPAQRWTWFMAMPMVIMYLSERKHKKWQIDKPRGINKLKTKHGHPPFLTGKYCIFVLWSVDRNGCILLRAHYWWALQMHVPPTWFLSSRCCPQEHHPHGSNTVGSKYFLKINQFYLQCCRAQHWEQSEWHKTNTNNKIRFCCC